MSEKKKELKEQLFGRTIYSEIESLAAKGRESSKGSAAFTAHQQPAQVAPPWIWQKPLIWGERQQPQLKLLPTLENREESSSAKSGLVHPYSSSTSAPLCYASNLPAAQWRGRRLQRSCRLRRLLGAVPNQLCAAVSWSQGEKYEQKK